MRICGRAACAQAIERSNTHCYASTYIGPIRVPISLRMHTWWELHAMTHELSLTHKYAEVVFVHCHAQVCQDSVACTCGL
eukprot:1731924-Alexandrium_andersonii.AAC.1